MKRLILTTLIATLAFAGAPADAKKKKKKKGEETELVGPPPTSHGPISAEKIMGKDARAVMSYFGKPALDVREDKARKLQFSNKDCILDAYLYPPSEGKEAVVIWLSARVPDGRDAERNSCITALSRG